MLIDARTLPSDETLHGDVVVVGAGPAGITIARTLVDTGVRVVLVESGGLEPSPEAQALNTGRSIGYPYHPLERARFRQFGGMSNRWELDLARGDSGWYARPLDQVDFEARPGLRDTGWPFGRAELEPYYARAAALAHLGPPTWATEDWAEESAPALDDATGTATAMFQFGLHTFHPVGLALRDEPACTVVINATVRRVELDESGERVDHVVASPRSGTTIRIAAPRVVLAAGAIENARLLLLSRTRHAAGLGNGHDLVGRYFMERLSARSGYIEATPALLERSLDLYRPRVVRGTHVRGALRLPEDVIRREGLLNATFFIIRRPVGFASEGGRSFVTLYRAFRRHPRVKHLRGHARNVLRDLPSVARTGLWLASRGRREEGDALLLAAQCEQSANEASRVLLDDTATDALGDPRPVLDWRVAQRDRDSIRRTQDLLSQRLEAAGLGTIRRRMGEERPPALFIGGFHQMGTTRMDPDERSGVVDVDGGVHGVRGLFVTGSSVFPTTGYANPTMTVLAMAIRLADHLERLTTSTPTPAVTGATDEAIPATAGKEPSGG